MKNLVWMLLPLLAGCASSRVVSSWTSPEAGKAVYQKILVISHMAGADSNRRLQMEEYMTESFRAIGYNAVSYLKTFHEKNFGLLPYDSMRSRFQQEGIDGMIIIQLLAKEKESVFVPVRQPLSKETLRQAGLSGKDMRRDAATQPGYYVSSTQLSWESSFYDVGTQTLLYKVQSTSFDPVPLQKLAQHFGRQIATDLQKNYRLATK